MNKIIIGILIGVMLLVGGAAFYFGYKYYRLIIPPEERVVIMSNELRGVGKLILAEQRVYEEDTKIYKKEILHKTISQAKVLFRWLANFQYFIDLQDPAFSVVKSGSTIKISCPAIQLNDPAIDMKTFKPSIVLEGGLLIDEKRKIIEEMPNFKSKSIKTGQELMKDPRVVKMCTDQVKLAVYKIVSGMLIPATDIEVTFGAAQPKP